MRYIMSRPEGPLLYTNFDINYVKEIRTIETRGARLLLIVVDYGLEIPDLNSYIQLTYDFFEEQGLFIRLKQLPIF